MNVYRHDYEDVLEQQLWNTVKHSLEPLQPVAEQELRRIEQG